jgi:hypothetical protein
MLDFTNRGLSKLDPRTFPRDPGALTTRVYRIGDVEPFFTLVGLPGHRSWHSKSTVIADYFQCDRDDVGTLELEDGTEAIVIFGRIVGSFDRPISAEDASR